MEAKPQLVGIHERVRNDIDAPPSSENGEKRISTATNPNAEEAADLLRYELYISLLPLPSFFPKP